MQEENVSHRRGTALLLALAALEIGEEETRAEEELVNVLKDGFSVRVRQDRVALLVKDLRALKAQSGAERTSWMTVRRL